MIAVSVEAHTELHKYYLYKYSCSQCGRDYGSDSPDVIPICPLCSPRGSRYLKSSP